MSLSQYLVVCLNLETNEESPPFFVMAPAVCGHNKIVAAARLVYPDMQVDRYRR